MSPSFSNASRPETKIVPAARVSEIHRTAFVTGASTGLGRAFTEMLLRESVRVWGTSRDAARLDQLVTRYSSLFTPVAFDLRNGAHAEAVFREAEAEAGGFDLVVNNAGYGVFAPFAAAEFSVWEEQLQVMLVNISSLAAEFPLPFQSAYNIAKAGLTALNESLMMEVSGTGVVILDVRPGDYRTDFEGSVLRPTVESTPRLTRAWAAFEAMMRGGPAPAHAAASVRRALLRNRSGTVRTGRFFQAMVAPFLARFGSLALKRRIQAGYFDVS